MEKFIKFDDSDCGQKCYRLINLYHVITLKVSEKMNKIELKMDDGSCYNMEFGDKSEFEKIEKELLYKIDHLYPKENIRF